MENVLVTGGAGFIGSHLIEKLLDGTRKVVCVDNYTLGSIKNIERFIQDPNFVLIDAEADDIGTLDKIFKEYNIMRVFHLAANSDIQKSSKDPKIDFKNTFGTTYAVLECMRMNDVHELFFSSTSAIYGDKQGQLITEDMGGLAPISYYGSGKLASESFINAYSFMNDINALIFRFPNVIGPGLTHGVIFDFIKKLKANPSKLEILGDGKQNKPYIYVDDLVDAIFDFSYRGLKGVTVFNVGVEGTTTVTEIADMVCDRMGLTDVEYCYTGGSVGWKGDVKSFQYDLSKIHAAGWAAKHDSNGSVRETLRNLEI